MYQQSLNVKLARVLNSNKVMEGSLLHNIGFDVAQNERQLLPNNGQVPIFK